MTSPYPDTFKLQGLRQKLVRQLQEKGIADPAVLAAVGQVPRHAFVESAFAEKAYLDIPLPIGEDQTISQPYTVAYMTEALQVRPGDRVLEIGTGSGYQAAILAAMGCKVFSVERIRSLSQRAKKVLQALGYHIYLKVGDGTLGWPLHGPYQGIIVTAGGPSVPEKLLTQLAVGGRMIIPVGNRESQQMLEIRRLTEDEFQKIAHPKFRFVPLIGAQGWGG